MILPGLGALPQVETQHDIATPLHLDSTNNRARVIANMAVRDVLDTQRDEMLEDGNPKAQHLLGDLNTSYDSDSRRTKLFRAFNPMTRQIPKYWPGFSFYDGNTLTQALSDGVRVCDMPNDKTMGILTGGIDGFINAAGPGESAATLFKGPVEIRSDHILGRAAEGTMLSYANYRVHPLMSGDHAAISALAAITDIALAHAA